MKKWLIFLVTIGFILLILIASWSYYRSEKGVRVKTVKVEEGPLYETVTVTGKVVSKEEITISSSAYGEIVRVFVREGETVSKGEVLAQIDSREAVRTVNKGEANLAHAQTEVAQTARVLERLRALLEAGGESRQAVEDAESSWKSAQAREKVAEEELFSAKIALDKLKTTAPFSGLVTSVSAKTGQWASSGGPLFTLVDLTQREIEAKVDAEDSSSIAVGQIAVVSSDAYPGITWTETVLRIAPAVNKEGDTHTVNVRITLGPSAPSLRFGQQVDLKIHTVEEPNTLKLPFGAFSTKDGKKWVATIQSGRVHFVPVVTGMEDFTHTEILKGLQAGQEVIFPEGKILTEGDRVKAIENK